MAMLCDFETRSRAPLAGPNGIGGRNYARHETTEVLCAVCHDTETGKVWVWRPGDEPIRCEVAVAHNAMHFDRFIAERAGWRVGKWLDSAQAALRAGLPAALDALGQRWANTPKDKEASTFTRKLSRPSTAKATLGQLPELTPAVMAKVVRYCATDTRILSRTWSELEPWFEVDRAVCETDLAVNDRGVMVDLELAARLQEEFALCAYQVCEQAARDLGCTPEEAQRMASSHQQFTAATGLPNAQAATITEAVESGLEHPLLSVRQTTSAVAPAKLKALFLKSTDGVLYDSLKYYGGHTGRWAGKGFQLQNLPKGTMGELAEELGISVGELTMRTLDHVLAGGRVDAQMVTNMVRALVRARPGCTLIGLDLAGIEARMLAWAAGDQAALDNYAAKDRGEGKDPYKVLAATMFGVDYDAVTKPQRHVGKQASLACQYQCGAKTFGETALKAGVDFDALGLTAKGVVEGYRNANPGITQLWDDCDYAFRQAIKGRTNKAGPWTFAPVDTPEGLGVQTTLSSGRVIVYPAARLRNQRKQAEDGTWYERIGPVYRGHNFDGKSVYGGLLTENNVQADARDVLAEAFVEAERRGLNPTMSVHDEIVVEVDKAAVKEARAELDEIMSRPPEWCADVPLAVDGFTGERYQK